jgi:hypothetical protein
MTMKCGWNHKSMERVYNMELTFMSKQQVGNLLHDNYGQLVMNRKYIMHSYQVLCQLVHISYYPQTDYKRKWKMVERCQ